MLALSAVRPYVALVTENQEDLLDEPLAEADGVDCDAVADECDLAAAERDGDAFASETSLRNEIFEAFKPVTEVMVTSPYDGMPIPASDRSDLAIAHPFTRETVVCVEDDTVYVELFEEELFERGWTTTSTSNVWKPSLHAKPGHEIKSRSRFDSDGLPVARREFDPQTVETRFGRSFAVVGDERVAVRMRRERCKHFLRQVMANDDQPNPKEPGHLLRFLNCSARKSVGGALMTLRDEAVYACDYRTPNDPETTEKYLDSFDRERLNSKRHLEMISPFNLR